MHSPGTIPGRWEPPTRGGRPAALSGSDRIIDGQGSRRFVSSHITDPPDWLWVAEDSLSLRIEHRRGRNSLWHGPPLWHGPETMPQRGGRGGCSAGRWHDA